MKILTKVLFLAVAASVLAIATDAGAAALPPAPPEQGLIGCSSDAECLVDGRPGLCDLRVDICNASSIDFVAVGYSKVTCDNPQVLAICPTYFPDSKQSCRVEKIDDPVTGELVELYIHLACILPDVDEVVCASMADNPYLAMSEYFDGQCLYPDMCGDGWWSPKEVCDPTAEVTGCKGDDYCFNCMKCLQECTNGDPCAAKDECGYGTCDLQVTANRCTYTMDANPYVTSCDVIEQFEASELGGAEICDNLYQKDVLEVCVINEFGALELYCEHPDGLDETLCTKLDDALLTTEYINDPEQDRCIYTLNMLGDTTACKAISDVDPCNAVEGCFWMESEDG